MDDDFEPRRLTVDEAHFMVVGRMLLAGLGGGALLAVVQGGVIGLTAGVVFGALVQTANCFVMLTLVRRRPIPPRGPLLLLPIVSATALSVLAMLHGPAAAGTLSVGIVAGGSALLALHLYGWCMAPLCSAHDA